MYYKSRKFSWSVKVHCVNKYKERVENGPERRNATSNDIRKIIRSALNNVNLDEILELEDTKYLYPVKFTKRGDPYYIIAQQDRVITIYTEEMYNNGNLKRKAHKLNNKTPHETIENKVPFNSLAYNTY